jgi:GT2 family glycosyltransferase
MSHPFGVGNAQFRLGIRSGFVDTVYLGCFRREVFDKVGLFDEDPSVISEDSDINQRISGTGGKVYLNKDIVAYYYPRETFREFWMLYFRYGNARAGNLLKHRRLTSWRQAVAPLFLLSLLILPMLAVWDYRFLYLLGGLLGLYLLINLAVSLGLMIKQKKPTLFSRLLLAFPCMHFAWALGFWKRLLIPDRPGTYWNN